MSTNFAQYSNVQARWQPQVDVKAELGKNLTLAAEGIASLDVQKEFQPYNGDIFITTGMYRLWAKAEGDKYELRVGLQQLNFGSAMLLRPLQWFDELDARDRLQQTRGVEAALLRYYWLNNANLWLWGIRGEGLKRGVQPLVTRKDTPEIGGRLQYPLPHGDVAVTYHHREHTLRPGRWFYPPVNTGEENSAGFDVRLDYGIGIWAEAAVSHIDKNIDYPQWRSSATVGGDYTFPIGNGIHLTAEQQVNQAGDEVLDFPLAKKNFTGAVSVDYGIGILDRLLYYGVYEYNGTGNLQSLIWRRQYDKLSWDTMLLNYGDRFISRDWGVQVSVSVTF